MDSIHIRNGKSVEGWSTLYLSGKAELTFLPVSYCQNCYFTPGISCLLEHVIEEAE